MLCVFLLWQGRGRDDCKSFHPKTMARCHHHSKDGTLASTVNFHPCARDWSLYVVVLAISMANVILASMVDAITIIIRDDRHNSTACANKIC